MKKLKRKTKWMGLLLSLNMVMALLPTTAFAEGTESSATASAGKHVLCKENDWDISDELIMPGESFYFEPEYTVKYEPLTAGTPQVGARIMLSNASFVLGEVVVDDSCLTQSTADTGLEPITTNYNVIEMAYANGDLDPVFSSATAEERNALMSAIRNGSITLTTGYVNNTNTPIRIGQIKMSSTMDAGAVYGGEFGMTLLVMANYTKRSGCTITYYEPYYTLSYEGLLPGEEKGLPDRFYAQNGNQELELPNPVRPGYHFTYWDGMYAADHIKSKSGDKTILSIKFPCTINPDLGFTLTPRFEQGTTITFNPNGGTIGGEDSAFYELDQFSEDFFDISDYVPKRDGYTFEGWCSYPSADDDSLIKDTSNYEWVGQWAKDYDSGLHSERYDIQLYAKWKKTDPCANGHKPQKTVAKATVSSDGKIITKCSVCNEILSTEIISRASNISLSDTSYTYDGKVKKPYVTVKDDKGKTVSSANYTVSYAKGCKNVGTYAVTVKFKGNYSGTVKKTFTIKPKPTSVSKLTAGRKKFTVKWKKQATQTTGYQIQYSISSKFKNARTVTVSKNKTTGKTVSKLKEKKKYYVRIRTYKTVKAGGKSTKIYSSWSKAKTVKVK